MNAWRTAIGFAVALSTLAAGTAAAQGKDKSKQDDDKCKIDFGANDQVRTAYNNVTVLQIGAAKGADAKKKLQTAVRALTSRPDFGRDQLARNFTLGEALVMWSEQDSVPPVALRGDLGYETNKTDSVDVLAAADSAFRSVETAMPECSEKTLIFRQQPWARLINQVGPLINRDQIDSATQVLDRSMTIYRGSPFSFYFKGQIAQRQNNWEAASEAYKQAADLSTPEQAAKDSTVANIREYSMFSAAYAQLKAAQGDSGQLQKDGMKKAAELYRAYLKEYPSGPNAQPAQAGLTAALQASGDTQSLASLWNEMLANPSKYTDAQLYDAGTQAFSQGNVPMAVKLMEAGQQANPYLRAGLFNLANAYWKNNQFDKMLPVAEQLTELDPNNPDNYQLVAIAFQGEQKASTDAKAKRALNDSVTKYVRLSERLPVRVTFSEFTHDGTKYKLAGTVENTSGAARKDTLTVEFLDRTGKVVATQSAPVPVAPKESAPFTMEADGATIAGFRYAPIKGTAAPAKGKTKSD
jgi:tetratricopeptide (TPR) repeat protein